MNHSSDALKTVMVDNITNHNNMIHSSNNQPQHEPLLRLQTSKTNKITKQCENLQILWFLKQVATFVYQCIEKPNEEFEDTKGEIRSRISKNRQHNGQAEKYKRTNNDLTIVYKTLS
jgi:hypothetical protein